MIPSMNNIQVVEANEDIIIDAENLEHIEIESSHIENLEYVELENSDAENLEHVDLLDLEEDLDELEENLKEEKLENHSSENIEVQSPESNIESVTENPNISLTMELQKESSVDTIQEDIDDNLNNINGDYTTTTDFTFDAETNTITGYSSSLTATKNIIIPAKIGEHDVLHIAANAFAGQQLTSVSFEEESVLISIGKEAFYNNLTLTGYIEMPDTLTSIGSNAFYYTKLSAIFFNNDTVFSGLGVIEHNYNGSGNWNTIGIETALVYPHMTYDLDQAITINNNTNTLIRHYPEHLDEICTDIIIPDYVEIINEYAFYNDSNITNVSFPSNLISVKKEAFRNTNLQELDLSNGKLTNIDSAAFAYTPIQSIKFPTTLEHIDESGFYYCSNLTEILGMEDSNLDTVGNFAFQYCSKLTEIVLPKELTTLGNSAFSYTAIETFEIPYKITDLPNSLFASCTELTEIISMSPIKTIGSSTFGSTSTLTNLYTYPEENFFEEVISIAGSAFSGCGLSIDITLPNLETLSKEAFMGNRFTGIHITSQKLTSIPEKAFAPSIYTSSGSRYLERLTIPESLQEISGTSAFYNNWYLYQINLAKADGTIIYDYNGLPEGITNIPNYTFSTNKALTSFHIPDSVISIGSYAFASCTSLKDVYLGSKVETIGSNAFSSTYNLYIDMPTNTIETISAIASTTWVIWNDNVITEGFDEEGESYGQFLLVQKEGDEDYTLLRTRISGADYYIPHIVYDVNDLETEYKIYQIGTGVFGSNYTVTSLEFEQGISHYEEEIALGAQSITKIIIPDGIEYMADNALKTIQKVSYLSIGEGLVTLPSNCVPGGNNIKTLILPDSLLYIKADAFNGVHSALTTLTINSRVEFLVSEDTNTCNLSTAISYLYLPAYSSIEEVPGLKNTAYTKSIMNIIYKDSHLTDDGLHYYNIDSSTLAKYVGNDTALADLVLNIPEEVMVDGVTYIPTTIYEYYTYTNNYSYGINIGEINVPSNITKIYDNAFVQRYKVNMASIIYLDMPIDTIQGAPWGNTHPAVKVLWNDSLRVGEYVYKIYEGDQIYISFYLGSSTVCDLTKFNELFDSPKNYEIVAITAGAFYDNDTVKEIILPNTIQYIGDYTFAECDKLENLTLPDEMPGDGLGDYVIQNCASLKEIKIPQGIQNNGDFLGYNCPSLEYISIPSSVTSHGNSFLGGTTFKLTNLVVEYLDRTENNKVDELILTNDFEYCRIESWMEPTYDKSYHYPAKTFSDPVLYSDRIYQDGFVYSITRESIIGHFDHEGTGRDTVIVPDYFYGEDGSVYESNRLHSELRIIYNDLRYTETIHLAETIKTIDAKLFKYSALVEVELPEGLESIGNEVFYNSANLVSVKMPSTLKSISSKSFYECSALEYVYIGHNVETIEDDAFNGASSLEHIWVPESVKDIGRTAFYNCISLKNISLNNGLETVGDTAFAYISAESITFPNSVVSLGSNICIGASQLHTVYVGTSYSKIEIIEDDTFSNINALDNIYIAQYRNNVKVDTTKLQPWGADSEVVTVRYLGEYVSFGHKITQVFPAFDHYAPATTASEELETSVHFDIDIWAFCNYNLILEIQLPEDENGDVYSFYPSSKTWYSEEDSYKYEVLEYGTYTFVGFDTDQTVGASYHIFVEDWSLPIVYAEDVILTLEEASNITESELLAAANGSAETIEGYILKQVLGENDILEIQSMEVVGDHYVATLAATDYRYLSTTIVQFNVIIEDETPPYIFGEDVVTLDADNLENFKISNGEVDNLIVDYVKNKVVEYADVWAIEYFNYHNLYIPDMIRPEGEMLLDIKVETDISQMYNDLLEDGSFTVEYSAFDESSGHTVYHTTIFRYLENGTEESTPLIPLEPSKPLEDEKESTPLIPLEPSKPLEDEEESTPLIPLEPSKPLEDEEESIPLIPLEPSKPLDDEEESIPLIPLEPSKPLEDEEENIPLIPLKPSISLEKDENDEKEDIPSSQMMDDDPLQNGEIPNTSDTTPIYGWLMMMLSTGSVIVRKKRR